MTRQIAVSPRLRTTIKAIKVGSSVFGGKMKMPATASAAKPAMTSQPCHVQGSPHPQPNFLAGNQYFGTDVMGSLLGVSAPNVGVQARGQAQPDTGSHSNELYDTCPLGGCGGYSLPLYAIGLLSIPISRRISLSSERAFSLIFSQSYCAFP